MKEKSLFVGVIALVLVLPALIFGGVSIVKSSTPVTPPITPPTGTPTPTPPVTPPVTPTPTATVSATPTPTATPATVKKLPIFIGPPVRVF